MLRTLALTICGVALTTALIAVPLLSCQETKQPVAAPVPAQIAAARRVFISNGGADLTAQATFKRGGEPDQAYNHFYSAMQSWGHYEIVSTPGEADVVLEISFTAPTYWDGNASIYQPQFGLNIFDAKTHFLLWSLSEPVEGAFRKATWVKNFDHGLDNVMDDLKKLSGVSPTDGGNPKK